MTHFRDSEVPLRAVLRVALDWHVKKRQPINTTRLPEGRYGLVFMFTTVVLRPEQTANFIGWGYDTR